MLKNVQFSSLSCIKLKDAEMFEGSFYDNDCFFVLAFMLLYTPF